MATSNPDTRAASLKSTVVGFEARDTAESATERDLADAAPDCHQCGATVRFVHAEPGDRGWHETHALRSGAGKQTVIEHVRCPDCDAGGARVKLAEDDRVVRKFGPATRNLRGRSAAARERERRREARRPVTEAPPADAVLAAGWSE